MNSDYKDNRPFKSNGVIRSFRYALTGVSLAVLNERNMKIHLVTTFVVIILGFILKLSTIEWLFIIFAIGGVLSLELINTAIERFVDLVTSDYHPLAKEAKDLSAGAVFIYSILAIIVGMIIFLPKLFQLFS